jgi:prolyl-tRNA editing enzyme YbaK/EbsC (Cys-tRNA(Pro) deacylase)
VQDAADSLGADIDDIIKNICLIDSKNRFIIGIVMGKHRVSTSRVAKFLNIESVRTATPEEILQYSGYPVGGVPSFGFDAIFLMDKKVMEKETIFSSGGSQTSLIKVSTKAMQRATHAHILRIRK